MANVSPLLSTPGTTQMPTQGTDLKALTAELGQAITNMHARWKEAVAPIQEIWSTHRVEIANFFVNVRESLAALPGDIESVSKSLAGRGWYIDSEMPITVLRPVLACFVEGREAEVDEFFVRHFSSRVESLQDQLLASYPLRSKPLTQAFAAHRSGQYELSIAVFLAQADGICAQVLGGKLFQKRDGRPQVAKKLEAMDLPDSSGVFLSVLGLPGGICANEEFRVKFPNCLNRHEILHGIDSNYGTEMNGWKAISLVGFVGLFASNLVQQA